MDDSSERWLYRRMSSETGPVSAKELAEQSNDVPQFWRDDMDHAYRNGFEDGFDYCIEQFENLHSKKGFQRTREICNILWHWSSTVLRNWAVCGLGMFKAKEFHPTFCFDESWPDIRKRILRRDRCCLRCKDVVNLEVDHIIEVQDGGLPVDSNLRVLCRKCHKSKSTWNVFDPVTKRRPLFCPLNNK